MIASPAQIIDDKGGPAAMAALVGRKPGAVRAWKFRNAFPREAWPELIQAYQDITLERLMEIESAPSDQPAPMPASAPAEAEAVAG